MSKYPIKSFQAGGATPSQDQQKLLAAFVEWLPTRVKEFANMKPEEIVNTLNRLSKTPEGQKQVESLISAFQQEINGGASKFKKGGKIHQFLCKHARGGHVADCGCSKKMQEGGKNGYAEIYPGKEVVNDEYNNITLFTRPGRDSSFIYTYWQQPPVRVLRKYVGDTPETIYLQGNIPNMSAPDAFNTCRNRFETLKNLYNHQTNAKVNKKQEGGEVNYSQEMYSSPDGIDIVERTPRLTRYITESDNGVRDTALYVKKSRNIYNSPFSRSYPGVPSRSAWKKANKEIDDARDADLLGKTNRLVDLSKLLNLNKSYINL